MTTVEKLLKEGSIIKLEVPLRAGEQAQRLLYGTPRFISWLEFIAQPVERPTTCETNAAEQLDGIFYLFISGRPLVFSRQFRFINAEKNAVWELKTPDLRVFGWFMLKDCFVAAFGDWADRVKDHDLYRGYRLEVRRLRRELGVEDTLCVRGLEPTDVLSL